MATIAQAKKKRCYYEVLGVPKKSSEQEIKAAYRKMALKYHPDRNQDNKVAAEEAFKEVSEAYAVLGDPQKRANYDNYGAAGSQGMPFEGNGGFQGQTMSREQAEAIFKSLFGGMGGMGGMDLGKILSQHGFAFRAGSMGGTSQQSEQSMFRNGKGQMVMRTRTRVRMPDGTIKEQVTERILGGR